jgi:hypothetical protein
MLSAVTNTWAHCIMEKIQFDDRMGGEETEEVDEMGVIKRQVAMSKRIKINT